MNEIVRIGVSLLPVFAFLAVLIVLDSYKLVKLRAVLLAIVLGCAVALVCLVLNRWLLDVLDLDFRTFSKYLAPLVEETFKAMYIVYLIKAKRVGFMVDAAIHGFAVGAGFAFVENLVYLQMLESSGILVWIVRGFGTAVMHGTTTAIFAILAQNAVERKGTDAWFLFLLPLLAAVVTHSIYNHFFLPPLLVTVAFVVGLPTLAVAVVFPTPPLPELTATT